VRSFRKLSFTTSGAYLSKTYQHGPESWTHKWTHLGVGTQFSLDSLRIFGGGSLANKLLRTGLFCALATGPTSTAQVSARKK